MQRRPIYKFPHQKYSQEEQFKLDGMIKNLLDLFSNPVVIIDRKGLLLGANEKALEMMRVTKYEQYNRNFLNSGILTPDCRDALFKYLSREFSESKKKEFKTEFPSGNNKQVQIEFSVIKTIYNDKPSALVSFRIFKEREHVLTKMVEERTRDLKQNEEKLWTILNSSPDAIIVTDIHGTITDCNQATLEIHGSSSKEEIIGRNIIELLTERDREKALKDFNRAINEGSIKNLEYLFLTLNEHELSVELSVNAVRDATGGVSSLVVQVKDITKRKHMEEDLRQYSLHLEKLVSEKTRMLREAERMAAIGEFAAMVGHDLRNPLTAIAGAAYYLKTKISSKLDDKTMKMFDYIEKGINYSNKIINDLLDYSNDIQIIYSVTTPRELILESLLLTNIPSNVDVINETQNKPKIRVDPEKMKRAFINIIKNSIEAMPNGGKLIIKGRKAKGYYIFSFSDTGIGISEEVKRRLWSPLVTSKAKGMGLGLAICKRMIDAHTGSIVLKSRTGKGTTLIVKVPIEPRQKEKPIVMSD